MSHIEETALEFINSVLLLSIAGLRRINVNVFRFESTVSNFTEKFKLPLPCLLNDVK